jgi:hypothetical protein
MSNQSDVLSGNARRHPTPKWLYRLRAPWRWWHRSIVRIFAEEFCNFPRRIAAILRTPSLAIGWRIPKGISDHMVDSPGSFLSVNSWPHACSSNMLSLQSQHPWLGSLELEICCLAFQRGAEYHAHTICNESDIALPGSGSLKA